MELINEPKTAYLLDASIETMHVESREWLSEIAFWGDEMSFFYKLIHSRQPQVSFPTEEQADLEKQMIHITAENLTKLRTAVEAHERMLHALLTNTSRNEDADYRHAHRSILLDIFSTGRLIKNLKKRVISILK